MINSNELSNFTGTENYYKDFMGLVLTDGTKYFMDNCRCGWLISDIAVINAMDKKILENRANGNNFLIVSLKIDRINKKCEWNLREDSDEPILYSQKYDYTDIAEHYGEDEIKFYLIDNILLLESEY